MTPLMKVAAFVAVLGALTVPSRVDAAPCLVTTVACISIDPSITNVSVGDTFFVDVKAEDVVDLFAYDVEVAFDPFFVRVLSITDRFFLSGGSVSGTGNFLSGSDNTLGEGFGSDSRLGFGTPGVSDGGLGAVLYTIKVKARAAGTTVIDFDTVCDQQDPFCTELQDSTTASLPYSTASGVVNIRQPTSVPEPSLLALIAVGAGIARSRRSRSLIQK